MAAPRTVRDEWLLPIRIETRAEIDAPVALGPLEMQKLAFREVNVKEAFTLVDGSGAYFRASLKEASDEGGRAVVYEKMNGSPESRAKITLVCAVLSRQRMLVVVQKATELGCVRIVPVQTDHSVKPADLEREKPWAWAGQAIKACKQCRRASVPAVQQITPLASALAAPFWTSATERFWLDDHTKSEDPFLGQPDEGSYVLAVGPEGGWSDRERALFEKSARAVPLGTRVVRAETAVFVGLSVLQHRLGDLR
ncbi:16S rRNA (uracil(1498)-N(3))-methyltransferase [soil metagenome]